MLQSPSIACDKYAFDNEELEVDHEFNLMDIFTLSHPVEEPPQPKMLVGNDVTSICTSTTASPI